MAGFHTKTFLKHDDYMTPKYAWENIKDYIPTNKVIWEAFYGDGKSGTYLQELGFEVIHEPIDFFENSKGDVIVSNPPFSKSNEVLTRLKELNKPFIVIFPSSKINTQYVRNLFMNTTDPLQIIIPRKRIHFEKKVDGETPAGWKNACNFDCFYYCWKVGLPRDIVWLK
jgi:Adenine-specific methyltransferase EcoRI